MVLTVKEVMDPRFPAVGPGVNCLDGARQMVQERHGFLLIVGGDGRPQGIVTEWDYIEKVVARGADPAQTALLTIASRPVISCDQGRPTAEVIALMVEKGIRRMVITDQGRVVGVVGAKDVLRIFQAYVDRVSADIARLHSSFP